MGGKRTEALRASKKNVNKQSQEIGGWGDTPPPQKSKTKIRFIRKGKILTHKNIFK